LGRDLDAMLAQQLFRIVRHGASITPNPDSVQIRTVSNPYRRACRESGWDSP
jgi:hypothetical protein